MLDIYYLVIMSYLKQLALTIITFMKQKTYSQVYSILSKYLLQMPLANLY